MMYYAGFPWFAFLLLCGGVLLVVSLVLGIVYIESNNKKRMPQAKNERFLQELKLTFAQGKIDEEEYLKRKKILEDE